MTTTTAERSVRTYGGWRRSHGIGLGNLDTRQTVAVVGSIFLVVLASAVVGPQAVVVLGAPLLVVVAVSLWRRDGVLLLDYLHGWVGFHTARLRGETSYRGQVLTRWPRSAGLPGVLAATELLDVEVPGYERCGLVWDRRSGLLSSTLLLSTGGTLLTDTDVAAGYVASWGYTLAGLADLPAVRWAAVTVEITPDGGTALAADHAHRVDPAAPLLARAILGEVAQVAPAAAARVSTRLTLTVDPAHGGTRVDSLADGAAQTLRVLAGVTPSASGADVLRRATAADLVRMVRTAYDPAARTARPTEWESLGWGDAGPVGAEEHPDRYDHDGAHSVTWALLAAPRQRVAHGVLLRLLSPGRFTRRVTLTYRVLSTDEAGGLLEQQQTAAAVRGEYRARTRRDETARERSDRTLSDAQAEEEAAGAGLVQFSVFVTTTVTDPADLPAAKAEVTAAAGGSRLKLRVSRFAQAAGFAAGLPCGMYPPYEKKRR